MSRGERTEQQAGALVGLLDGSGEVFAEGRVVLVGTMSEECSELFAIFSDDSLAQE